MRMVHFNEFTREIIFTAGQLIQHYSPKGINVLLGGSRDLFVTLMEGVITNGGAEGYGMYIREERNLRPLGLDYLAELLDSMNLSADLDDVTKMMVYNIFTISFNMLNMIDVEGEYSGFIRTSAVKSLTEYIKSRMYTLQGIELDLEYIDSELISIMFDCLQNIITNVEGD